MAKYTAGGELDKMIASFEKLEITDEMSRKCVEEGQTIMLNEIQKGANKHVETGKMAKSLGKSTPLYINGAWVGRVKFYGGEGVYVTKAGKKYDMTNWLKAFRIEYGTAKQKAKPFVKSAINRSRKQIAAKWQEIYDEELKKKL